MNLFSFLVSVGFWPALAQQVLLILLTVLLALAVGLPLGFASYKYHALTPPLIGLVNLLQTLPAFAVLGLFMALGLQNFTTSLLLAFLYTVLPVIFGTEKGLRRIGRAPIDAALGMGMTGWQVLRRVLLPLASPQILPGVRRAVITAVGTTTLATLHGGGLGVLILDGIYTGDTQRLLAGAVPACLLVLAANGGMALLHRRFVPAPLRRKEQREVFIEK